MDFPHLCFGSALALGSLTVYLLYERKQSDPGEEGAGSAQSDTDQSPGRRAETPGLRVDDDSSQRLALLSLGLETTAESVTESPEEAKQQLHQLLNSAGELGADITPFPIVCILPLWNGWAWCRE